MKTCERLARARSHHARAAVCTTCLMAPLPPCAPRRAAGAAGAAEAAEAAEEGRGGGAAAGLHLSSCCLPRCCCPLRVRDRTDSLTCTLVSGKRPLAAPPLTPLRAQVVPQARAPGDEYRRLAPAGGRPTQLVHRVWALAGRTGGRQPPHATRPSAHARCARLHGARLCGHA